MWSGFESQYKKQFRLEKLWLDHPGFDENITTWWEELSKGSRLSMFRLQQKLKALKAKLKNGIGKSLATFLLIKEL